MPPPPVPRAQILGAAVLLCTPLLSSAETAYVVDELMAGIRSGTAVADKVLRVVPTGTQLEVVERRGAHTRVRTGDGLEGWIDSSYLMAQAPAAVRIDAVEKALADAQAQLALKAVPPAQPTRSAPSASTATRVSAPFIVGVLGAILAALGLGFLSGALWRAGRDRHKLAGFKL